MEYRQKTIFSGQTFEVPKHIVRLDAKGTHGWQLRYGKWQLFSDASADGSGAQAALAAASAELARRISKLPAPTGLRTEVLQNKTSDLPVGISGPITRRRGDDSFEQYYLQVTYPVPGGKPVNRSVYIATENTLTHEKYANAIAKAVALRESGVRKFKLATTKSKRAEAQTSGL